MADDGYLLAIGSHKGGTGRTTAALALAWLWGQEGLHVTLADADPIHAAGLIALDDSDNCPWSNVQYVADLPEPGDPALAADIVLIDCPLLLTAEAGPILQRAAGVVLTCHADPLSLRTVPAAAERVGGRPNSEPSRRVDRRIDRRLHFRRSSSIADARPVAANARGSVAGTAGARRLGRSRFGAGAGIGLAGRTRRRRLRRNRPTAARSDRAVERGGACRPAGGLTPCARF